MFEFLKAQNHHETRFKNSAFIKKDQRAELTNHGAIRPVADRSREKRIVCKIVKLGIGTLS